ncbi:hypothetical protein PGTUg99_017588 [Puccinia graminis f. sp. tritici]|uniref:Uncharacterized protein n=1 Tax=Puccinia graminis f. sp. tritici TaxID=56615 RepID=A0A5B0QLQ7_PUCGR|nr:hypothetical protein PGTUg99_017588 [Puccinia graminis f. sp. tritici]
MTLASTPRVPPSRSGIASRGHGAETSSYSRHAKRDIEDVALGALAEKTPLRETKHYVTSTSNSNPKST